MDQLKLEDDEEVKAQDDEGENDDAEEHCVNLEEELLDEVSALPLDGVSKETQWLVEKALHSAEITKCLSKLTPAS